MEHVRPLERGAGARRLAQRRRADGAPLVGALVGQSLAARAAARCSAEPPWRRSALCCRMAAGISSTARSTSSSAPTATPDAVRRRARCRVAALRRPSSTSWSPNCRCCACRSRAPCPLHGAIARRMWAACQPFRAGFITPMAAVAGAVAQELIAQLRARRHRPRLGQQRRRHRAAPGAGPVRARRSVRRPGAARCAAVAQRHHDRRPLRRCARDCRCAAWPPAAGADAASRSASPTA